MISRGFTLAIVVAVAGFATFAAWAIRQNPRVPEEEAERVLVQAVELIQRDALMADGRDWQQQLAQAKTRAAQGGRLADLEDALQSLVQVLRERDGHSFYLPVARARALQAPAPVAGEDDLAELAPDEQGVPVLRINAWAPLDDARNAKAAADAVGLLDRALARHPCGLIVDLRHNSGGNMYPMFDALRSLLPPRDLGYFQARDGQVQPWPVAARTAAARPAAVAVLLGPGTASSGEFLAVGLRSVPRVRSFGAPTAGLTTGNQLYPLLNGGMLALTTVRMLDAQSRPVTGRLTPDEEHAEPLVPAAAWVRHQCDPRPTEGSGR